MTLVTVPPDSPGLDLGSPEGGWMVAARPPQVLPFSGAESLSWDACLLRLWFPARSNTLATEAIVHRALSLVSLENPSRSLQRIHYWGTGCVHLSTPFHFAWNWGLSWDVGFSDLKLGKSWENWDRLFTLRPQIFWEGTVVGLKSNWITFAHLVLFFLAWSRP